MHSNLNFAWGYFIQLIMALIPETLGARGHRLTFLLQGEMVALKAGRLGLLTTKDTRWDSYYQDGKSQQPLISSYGLCENTQDLIAKMSRKGI